VKISAATGRTETKEVVAAALSTTLPLLLWNLRRTMTRRKGVVRAGKKEKPFGKDLLVGGGSNTKKV